MKKTSPPSTKAVTRNTPTHRYRHYKSSEYEWLCETMYEPDPTIKMMVYRVTNGTIWIRSSMMFCETVGVNGWGMPRFALVD